MTNRIQSILHGERIALVDVGSSGGIQPRWQPYARSVNYIGFEPREGSPAIWSKPGPLTINLCRKPECSSALKPNRAFLDRFPDPERLDIIGETTVEAVTLDSAVDWCDFIKVDVQGGELEVLKGAPRVLKSCLGLEVEVSFAHIYEGQPLFSEIFDFLTRRGFSFIDFLTLYRWGDTRQCVFGDALFLREPKEGSQWKRYNAILEIYAPRRDWKQRVVRKVERILEKL